jgi:hypothetical protein
MSMQKIITLVCLVIILIALLVLTAKPKSVCMTASEAAVKTKKSCGCSGG